MPIRELECEKCKKLLEVILKTTEPVPQFCECGGKLTEQFPKKTGYILKGHGWHKSDWGSGF